MDEKTYTNRELAKDYFSVVAQCGADTATYNSKRRQIEALAIDLPAFYREHGSLTSLSGKGLGPKTRSVLELILGKGYDEARRIVRESKEEELRRFIASGWATVSSRVPRVGDDLPFDNIVKSCEGG